MKQTQDTNTPINSNISMDQVTQILAAIQQAQQNDPLRQLEYEEKVRLKGEREEQERVQKESRRQNAMAMDQRKKDMEAAQDACSHIKPNRQTNVVGQRDHSNHYHYICQTCQKTWSTEKDGEKIPNYLYPDPNMVGGPQF